MCPAVGHFFISVFLLTHISHRPPDFFMLHYKENPEHLFECVTPPPPEEILVYQHPLFPLKMYSNGIFFCDVDEWILTINDRYGVTVSRGWDKTYEADEFIAMWGGSRFGSKSQTTVRLKSPEALAYECYHGIQLPKSEQIMFWNYNPWDLRKENLFTSLDVPRGYKYRKHYMAQGLAFNTKTVQIMTEMADAAAERGWDPLAYMEALKIPNKWMSSWKKRYFAD